MTADETADETAEQARSKKYELQALIRSGSDHSDIAAMAKEYIKLNYAWQEIRFGKVRQKYSVSYLIRAVA